MEKAEQKSSRGIKKNISSISWGLIMLIVGIVGGIIIMYAVTPTNPLRQYIVTRTCEFIQMGDFSSAVCSDGTSWNVSPFQP